MTTNRLFLLRANDVGAANVFRSEEDTQIPGIRDMVTLI